MPKRKPKPEKKSPGRVPDFIVRAMSKDDDFKGEVGAAWIDGGPYDSITIKLNPFVVLDPRADNLVIKLFPNTYQKKGKVEQPEPEDDEDDDLQQSPPKPEDDLELKTAY